MTHQEKYEAVRRAAILVTRRGEKIILLHGIDENGSCTCAGASDRCHPGKHPRASVSGTIRATREPREVRRWFKAFPVSNFGIYARENRRLTLDVDPRKKGLETFRRLARELGPLPKTLKVLSGGADQGFHLSFKRPAEEMAARGGGIDIIDNAYTVAPPSLHESGRRYRWAKGCRPGDISLGTLPARWIEYFCRHGKRKNAITRPRALESIDPERASRILRRMIKRAPKFGRNNTGLWGATQLRDNGASIDDAATIMEQFLDEVAASGDHRYTVDEATATLASVYSAAPRDSWNQATPRSSGQLHLVSAADFMKREYPAKRYVLENRLPVGGTSLVAAKPKVGKTTLVTELAVRVARGESFLGWRCKKGAVICLFFEESEAEVQDHLKRLAVKPEDRIYLHFTNQVGKAGLSKLKRKIRKHRAVLVIVDSLFDLVRVRGGDSNGYLQVKNAMRPFYQLARTTGTHILATVHSGKSKDQHGVDSVIASTAIPGAVDTIIILKTKGSARTFETVQRYPKFCDASERNIPATQILFDATTGSLSLGGRSQDVELDRLRKEIRAFVSQAGSPVTREEIEDNVVGSTEMIRKAFYGLLQEHHLDRRGLGKRGSPFRFFVPRSSVN